MTEIVFHFNVADRIAYACRWLGRAHGRGGLAVSGDAATLERVDAELWKVEPAAFVPHARLASAARVPERLHAQTVWLVDDSAAAGGEDAAAAPGHDTLVNLGAKAPRGFESFRRLIEIVGSDEGDRVLGRERWKAYQSRGYTIGRVEASA